MGDGWNRAKLSGSAGFGRPAMISRSIGVGSAGFCNQSRRIYSRALIRHRELKPLDLPQIVCSVTMVFMWHISWDLETWWKRRFSLPHKFGPVVANKGDQTSTTVAVYKTSGSHQLMLYVITKYYRQFCLCLPRLQLVSVTIHKSMVSISLSVFAITDPESQIW